MDDATAQLHPDVLAALALELEGVRVDTSTEAGVLEASRLIGRKWAAGEYAEDALLDLIARHTPPCAHVASDEVFPDTYGPVITMPRQSPITAEERALFDELEPPIGSPEFCDYLDRPTSPTAILQATSDSVEGMEAAAQFVSPSELGFDHSLLKPPSRAAIDVALRDLQVELEHRRQRLPLSARLRAAIVAFSRAPRSNWSMLVLQPASNRFVVEATCAGTEGFLLDSIAAGDSLYVVLRDQGGHLRFKERYQLSDHAAVQRQLADAFHDQTLAGASAVRALRWAISKDDGSAASTQG